MDNINPEIVTAHKILNEYFESLAESVLETDDFELLELMNKFFDGTSTITPLEELRGHLDRVRDLAKERDYRQVILDLDNAGDALAHFLGLLAPAIKGKLN